MFPFVTWFFSCSNEGEFSYLQFNSVDDQVSIPVGVDELLPDSVNKCIYLDDDMIVKGEIKDLFESLDDKYFFGAVYPIIPYQLEKK